jgi:glycosyltransferase involved in cell wall biosynthesis
MRILFANEKRGAFGGVEQNVLDTARGLRSRGHRCTLAYAESTGKNEAAWDEAFEASTPCNELFAGGASEAGRSLSEIGDGADVVYMHKVPSAAPFLDWVNRLNTVSLPRLVRMVHDHDLCCPRRHKYFAHNGRICHQAAGWRCWLDLAFLEKSDGPLKVGFSPIGPKINEMRRNATLDALLVGSTFMREELLLNGFPDSRVHRVPPIVRPIDGEPTPPSSERSVLYVGQLIRGKGVDLFLEAFATLPNDVNATIVGTGNASEALQAQAAELGISDRVNFAGWVANEALDPLYRAARVVVVPSRWPEPFGMVGLEAMQRARPVVAFAVGGIPDWLEDGETGFLADEQDVETFASSIEKLLVDPDLAERMGRAGWQRARDDYSFESFLDAIEEHLGIAEVETSAGHELRPIRTAGG